MKKLNLLLAILGSTLANGLFAQHPGDLDSTFGTYGKVTTDFGIDEAAYSVAMQSDGKMVVAGIHYWEDFGGIGYSDFALARYNTDGTLDTTFGTGGKLTTDFGTLDEAKSVAIQCDGKIVVAGEVSGLLIVGKFDFALARYNADGTLDSSFSSDGKLVTDFTGDHDRISAMAIQPDGKIVVAGESRNASNYDFALARYNTDGILDTSFSTDGKERTAIGTGGDYAYAIAIQPDGAIVVAGKSLNGANNDFALARYNPNGTPDNGFSTDGKLTTNFGSDDIAWSVALQPGGKIVAAGSSYNAGKLLLARYNLNGTLDSSFGTSGLQITNLGAPAGGYAAALQPDGKIIIAGETNFNYVLLLARYDTDGTIDSSFSLDGLQTTDFGSDGVIANSIVLQSDGKIIVAGETDYNGISDFAIARYITGLNISDATIAGAIMTEEGKPVPGVTVTLSGGDTQTTTTANNGCYKFTVAQGGNYTVTPSRNNDIVTNNGISSIDILLIRRHILGTPFDSPYKIIAAAEVNADGDTTITTQDILFTRSLILGNTTSFPTGRLWQFVSSDYVFPDTQHPFPFPATRTYTNITTNQTNQDFIGIKLGDVNGSWAP